MNDFVSFLLSVHSMKTVFCNWKQWYFLLTSHAVRVVLCRYLRHISRERLLLLPFNFAFICDLLNLLSFKQSWSFMHDLLILLSLHDLLTLPSCMIFMSTFVHGNIIMLLYRVFNSAVIYSLLILPLFMVFYFSFHRCCFNSAFMHDLLTIDEWSCNFVPSCDLLIHLFLYTHLFL